MRPLVRSYGVISTRTLSPASTLMRFLRIRPAVWAMISCSFSSFTLNVALGSSSVTTPGNSSISSFAIRLLPSRSSRENGRASAQNQGRLHRLRRALFLLQLKQSAQRDVWACSPNEELGEKYDEVSWNRPVRGCRHSCVERDRR